MLAERWQTLTADTGLGQAPAADGRPCAALIDALAPLSFQGPDVINFLQGYLTRNLEDLADDSPHLAALTNLKGRVVATGWCQVRSSDRVDWLIHRDLTGMVGDFMTKYLAFSKTDLVPTDEETLSIGLIDPDGRPTARSVNSTAELDALLEHHQPVSAGVWRAACIEQAVTVVEPATSESFLPQMIGLVEANAVDFDKGCYLGQEVVARAQYRGEVKRKAMSLTGLSTAVAPGTPLEDENGKEAGTLLTSEPPLCLAVLRQPAAASYQAGGQTLEPVAR